MKKRFLTYIFLLFCLTNLWAEKKPNVILYVADDFGRVSMNALGAHEKFVKTPHLNALNTREMGLNSS